MKGAVIVAAGESTRFGQNKLNMPLFGKTILRQTIALFEGIADKIVVVGDFDLPNVTVVSGGKTRSQSVQNGLCALPNECKIVAVHDGARPFASRQLIQKLYDVCAKFDSAVPFLPITDTLWHTNAQNGYSILQAYSSENFSATCTPQNRDNFFTVQTPQVFNFQKLKAAFENSSDNFSDESTLFFNTYGNVHFVEGEFSNKKVTYPTDLPQFAVGVGFDVHPFDEGDGVILGGVKIPYSKKLVGHSDADVLTHAVCDAVLSGSGNRDIGVQFPDTDDRFLGANSLKLLAECVRLAQSNGFCVQNVSAVVICQQPKLAPFLKKMSQKLADVLQISYRSVNLSATTTEHLGALGNGDGIAAQAEALLAKKS